MNSFTFDGLDFSRMSVTQYRDLARACAAWYPNPFTAHVDGPWHERAFHEVVRGVTALLARFDAGKADEQQLLRGKDNDKRPGPNDVPLCHDTLSYWLYFQHHPGHELWKLLGQCYWSLDAYVCWCELTLLGGDGGNILVADKNTADGEHRSSDQHRGLAKGWHTVAVRDAERALCSVGRIKRASRAGR